MAVAVSMGLSGVWHGAALTFVVWAAMHITGVVVLNCLDRLRHWVLPKYLACTLTFLWVSAAWVFFRAESLDHAGAIFGGMFQSFSTTQPLVTYNLLGFSALLAGFFILQVKGPIWAAKIGRYWFKAPKWVFAVSLWFSLWLAIELGPSGVPNFIYAGF